MNARKKPGEKTAQARVFGTRLGDHQLRAAGYRKVPKKVAKGSFEDLMKWRHGK
jgi:hypothetical protein